MQTSNAYNAYRNNSINFASKEQLLMMLLDGAVKFSKIGRQAILDKDIQKAHENIIKTQNIFYELVISLDLAKAGDWGKDMVELYEFIIKRLTDANMKKDIKIIDEIIPLIEDIKETWNEAYNMSKNIR
ncbi:flagellar export chaperone FliS [Clostridium omnivorum]|uniref:Flagellar secretion chaperone FliS n=1 Tax=Clostridium omnivorum TaxID=1604902 RepID=A0ABQ5NAW2_9CLOT|nr:flagellar export chaperone FliS [Clostridium sp. E14]GLC32329.1 flagellar protein FliS [Clostridium sp. E14]